MDACPNWVESAQHSGADGTVEFSRYTAPRLHPRTAFSQSSKSFAKVCRAWVSPRTSSLAFRAKPKLISTRHFRWPEKCASTIRIFLNITPRRDTPAADMADQVSREIKRRTQRSIADRHQRNCGRNLPLLRGREGPNSGGRPQQEKSTSYDGRSRSNKIVVFDGSERHRGRLLDLKITRAGSFTLYGDPGALSDLKRTNSGRSRYRGSRS